MTGIEKIKSVVTEYAQTSPLFVTPVSENDPLVPQPEAMSDVQRKQFFNSFLEALAEGGIKAKLPFAALMGCDTWTQVRILVFHFQE